MRRTDHTACSRAASRTREPAVGERGSFLVEVMVSALVLLIAGAGILKMLDRGTELGGEQKTLAVAGTVAESEQETLRGYRMSKEGVAFLSTLRRTSTRTVDGTTFSITSRTDWINDASNDAECTTSAAPADYMKLTTTVTYPQIGSRRPVTLESLISPPARSFDANQGSLAVQVNDGSGNPVPGLTLNLSGPATRSEVTNANGCVLWGYLPAGSGYTIRAARDGWVESNGSPTIAESVSVAGDETRNVNLHYAPAGGISVNFTSQAASSTTVVPTRPQKAMLENANSRFSSRAFTVDGTSLSTGLALFPFTIPATPYTIYADGCASARPPTAAAWRGSAMAPAGATSAPVTVQLPALKIRVQYNGANQAGATVKLATACGTVFTDSTDSAGWITDAGFPYGTHAVCVSKAVGSPAVVRRRIVAAQANTTFPSTTPAVTNYDIGRTGSTTGACP